MRILLAEDDPISRKLISTILVDNGFQVVALSSGQRAAAYLESNELVDIILTDISMPVMNGYDLLAYLKADTRYSRIPVILCSSEHDLETVKKGLALGAADFLTKPIEPKALLDKIQKTSKDVQDAVLVVDDEKLLRDLLSQILRRDGLRVLTAADGCEALEVLETNRVSLVISDIAMPQMDGIELLGTIKERHPHLPVLLVTGNVSKYDKENTLKNGADGYIAKPFKNTEILQHVGQFIF